MKKTLESILDELNLNLEELKLDIKNYTTDKNLLIIESEKNDTPLSIVLFAINSLKESYFKKYYVPVGLYYFDKIFNDNYFLSVEDISKHLDFSIRHTQTYIIPQLDRIEFPSSDFLLKDLFKKFIFNNFDKLLKERTNLNTSNPKLKAKYLELFRKKVLFSKNSYIEFLKNNVVVVDNFIKKDMFISKKFLKSDTEKSFKIIRNSFNNFSNDFIKTHSLSNRINFSNLVNSYFNFNINTCNDFNYFKSISSLKVILNFSYDIQVIRAISNLTKYISVSINTSNSKKPSRRFLVDKAFLLTSFEESLDNNLDIEKNSLNSFCIKSEDTILVSDFKIPSCILKDFDINFLTESFNKYLEKL